MLASSGAMLHAETAVARPEPQFVAGKPEQAEGLRVLEAFRRMSLGGDYWMAFQLEVMPRRGAGFTLTGRMLGGRRDEASITRLILDGGRAGDDSRQRSGPLLIVGGRDGVVWRNDGGESRRLGENEVVQPLAGTDLAPFDLQMPFLYWTDFVYEGLARVRGRPTHRLLLYPPADVARATGLSGVRIFLDTQYQALVQVESLGIEGKLEKTVTVLDLKEIGGQWIVKTVDVRNQRTRDKTRFTVVAAALDLILPADTFAPSRLGTDAPVIPEAKVVRF